METIQIPQLPQLNVIDLNHHRRSTYWGFVIIFLGIISVSVLGLFAISAYERREEMQTNIVLENTKAARFIPASDRK